LLKVRVGENGLPYNSAQATKGIAILGVTLQNFTVTPAAPWTAGQTVTLRVQSVQDSTPRVGKKIQFTIIDMDTWEWAVLVEATTGSDGYAQASAAIPWTVGSSVIPCGNIYLRAYDVEAGVYSPAKPGAVAYPTRISISAPDQVTPGQTFTISGKLEYQSSPTAWARLAGRTVSLYYNGNKIADVTTGSDGSYSATASIPTSGTYTLKAVFAGEGFASASAAMLVRLQAVRLNAAIPVAGLTFGAIIVALAAKR
jgi:hypothetical protein